MSVLIALGAIGIVVGIMLVTFALQRRFLITEPAAPAPYLQRQIHETVIVHLSTGDSIQGVLVEDLTSGVLLKAAMFLDTDQSVPLAGETWVPSSKINFIQGATNA